MTLLELQEEKEMGHIYFASLPNVLGQKQCLA